MSTVRPKIYMLALAFVFTAFTAEATGNGFAQRILAQCQASTVQLLEENFPGSSHLFFPPPPSSTTISVYVTAGSDDAEENRSTISGSYEAVTTGSSDLELSDDSGITQLVGMRFNGLTIPSGSTITNAYIELTTDAAQTGACNLTIHGQAHANPVTFSTSSGNISSRTKTNSSVAVAWNPIAWNTVDEKHQTPDISAIIQEIINLSGWASGNSLVLMIEGGGTREAESYNGASTHGDLTKAPRLVIEFSEATTGGGCNDIIDSESFESDFGIWNSGGVDCFRSNSYVNSGSYSVDLQDNSLTSILTTNNLDLSVYSEVEVRFSYYTVSMDNDNEDFWLQLSTDGGSSFNTVEEWNTNDEFVNNVRYFDTVTVSGPFTTNTQLRFRCDASGNADDVYLDDIEIVGCTVTPATCNSGLLSNPDFESGTAGWGITGTTTVTNDAQFGSQAVVHTSSNGGIAQDYATTPGNAFSLSVYAKKTGTAEPVVGIKFFDASWNDLQTTDVNVTSTVYEEYLLSAVAPASTAWVQAIGWNGIGSGSAYFDAFCFEEMNITSPTCGSTSCELQPSFNNYIFAMDDSGVDDDWREYDNGDLILCDNGDGTLSIKGNIVNGQDAAWGNATAPPCGSQDGWYIDLTLSDMVSWQQFQGNFAVNASCPNANLDLDYWDVTGTFNGLGCNSGRTVIVNGSAPGYRFQIGTGGNSHSCNFGMSAWFSCTENGNPFKSDIYARIDESCYNSMRPSGQNCENNILNTEFDSGTSGWYVNEQSGNVASFSIDNSNQLSGANSAYVDISSVTGTNWHVQFVQYDLSLAAGQDYRVSFDAKAIADRNISVSLQRSDSPYTTYWWQDVSLTTAGATFSFDLTSDSTNVGQVGLIFHLGESAENVWIDNVSFSEICDVPFACETGFYQFFEYPAGSGDFEIALFDPTTSLYQTVFNFTQELNGLGFSLADGYMYGAEIGGNRNIFRVSANGTLTDLGVNYGPTNIYSGDIDGNNIWHGFVNDKVYRVNLNTLTTLPVITLTGHTATVIDYAYNAVDGKFYGVESSPDPSLYIYDPIAETISSSNLNGDIIGEVGGGKGAAWATADGSIYVGQNNTGVIYKIDPATGTTIALANAPSPIVLNDGISCATAPSPFVEICGNDSDDDGDGQVDEGCLSCTDNLLTNPDFENGVTGWGVNGSGGVATNDANSGSQAVSVTADDSGVYQDFNCTPGEVYTLSFAAKATGSPDWAGVGIIWWDASWNKIDEQAIDIYSLSSNYQNFNLVDEVPIGCAFGQVYVWRSAGGSGSIEADDFCLELTTGNDVDQCGEIFNSGFEYALMGWAGNINQASTSNDSYTGNQALQLDTDNTTINRVVAPITNGAMYEMTMYAKRTGNNGWGEGGMIWYDDSNTNLGSNYITIDSFVNEYTMFKLSSVAPAGATRLVMHFYKHSGDDILIDDVCLEENWATGECGCSENIFVNGSFESHNSNVTFPHTAEGNPIEVIVGNDVTKVPNWAGNSGTPGYNFWYYIDDNGDSVNNPDGDYFAWIPGDFCSSSVLAFSDLNLEDGVEYEICLSAAAWNIAHNASGTPTGAVVSQGKAEIKVELSSPSNAWQKVRTNWELPASASWGNLNWQKLSYRFVYDSSEPLWGLTLTNIAGIGSAIDAVSVSRVDCSDTDGCDYLPNRGFENGLSGWGNGGGSVTTTSDAYAGTTAASIGTDAYVGTTVPLNSGLSYDFEFWAKKPAGSGWGSFGYQFQDENRNNISGTQHSEEITEFAWTSKQVSLTNIPENAMFFNFWFSAGSSASDALYVDEVCFAEKPNGIEICGNGEDDDGDNLTDCADPDCEAPTNGSLTYSDPNNCPDLDNGEIVVTATGSNLQYSIDNGATYQASNTFSNLPEGTYIIRVRNSETGCSILVSSGSKPFVSLKDPDCPEICANGLDDDGDGSTDDNDPDCFSCSTSLVDNPGFSNDLTNWTDWGNATVVTENNGNKYVRVTGGEGGFGQNIPVLPGETVTLTFYGRNNVPNEATGGFSFLDGSLIQIGGDEVVFVNNTSFQVYTVTATAPANAAWVKAFGWNNDGNGEAEYDGFCLSKFAPEICGNNVDDDGDGTVDEIPLTNPYPGFPIDFLNDNTGWLDYDLGNDMVIVDNGDGTKTITGSLGNGTPVDFGAGINGSSCGATDGWDVTLVLSDKMDWATFQAAGGSANVHGSCNANIADLEYWDISGTLTGTGCNAGRTITITGPKPPYRLQVGYGANNGDSGCAFGMSTWFDAVEGAQSINADIYAFLDADCYDPPEICDNNLDDDGDCLIDEADPDCGSGTIYQTIADGNWSSSSTWLDGNVPDRFLGGESVYINHDVYMNLGDNIEIQNGTLNVNHILTMPNQNVSLGNSAGTLNINHGLLIMNNGNVNNTSGTVNFNGWGGVQICNASYNNDSGSGTNGTGYIYMINSSINNTSGTFSTGVEWCGDNDSSGNNLPTAENCTNVTIPSGCTDKTPFADIELYCGPEICGNGIDDDGDNLIDGADPDCPGLDPNVCYFISDGLGDGYLTQDTLYSFDHTNGSVSAIGGTGVYGIESMALDKVNDIIYTSSNDTFGIIDPNTGAFTAISNEYGNADGSAGVRTFDDVDGMTYDVVNNIIWATEREGSSDGLPDDMLFQINPSTGKFIPDAFGTGIDYVVVVTNEHDLDDIAIAADGTLYAISNYGGSGNQRLGIINKITGVFTEIGDYGIEDVEGLTFTSSGQMLATTGESGDHKNSLYSIDAATATASFVGSILPGNDVEACVCMHADFSNLIIGDKVWADINADGIQDFDEPGVENVTVKLLDGSGNPILDASSNPRTTTTDFFGNYSFDRLTAGDYAIEFVLPSGATFSPQNAGGDGTLDSDANASTGRTPVITLSGSVNNYSQDAGLQGINVAVRDCSNDGELFVADNTTGIIYRYDESTGALIGEFITGLETPRHMVVGPDDLLYVTEHESNKVKAFSLRTGALIKTIHSSILGGASGLTFGPDGKLYINTSWGDKIVRYDPALDTVGVFIAGNSGGMDSPRTGIEFGPDGNIYVCSKNSDEVLRFNGTTGAFIDVFGAATGTNLNAPWDLAFGPDGNLYVTSAYSDQVVRFDGNTGALIDNFVDYQSGGNDNPIDLRFGADGHLYVTVKSGVAEVFKYNGTTGDFIEVFTSGLTDPTGLLFAPVPSCVEICDNGIDDDGDDLIDGADPDCMCGGNASCDGIEIDNSTSKSGKEVSSLSWTHVVSSDANFLVVPITVNNNQTVSSAKFNGVDLDLEISGSYDGRTLYLYYMANPPSVLGSINISLSGTDKCDITAGAVSYSCVDTDSPFSAGMIEEHGQLPGVATVGGVNSCPSGTAIIDFLVTDDDNVASGSLQGILIDEDNPSNQEYLSSSYATESGAVLEWTLTNSEYVYIYGCLKACSTTEICDNGIDDDGDNLIDCSDPDCGKISDPGTIAYDQENCVGFDPFVIVNTTFPQNFDYACNLLQNGEFDDGTNNWWNYDGGGHASTWTIDNTSQVSGTNSSKIEVTTLGQSWAKVELGQGGVSLVEGKTYVLYFKGKADANKVVNVHLQNETYYDDLMSGSVNLTTEIQQFGPFFYTAAYDQPGRIIFDLSEDMTTAWIDDVMLAELECGMDIKWQQSIDNGITWTDISGATSFDYDPPMITQTTLYRRAVKSTTCGGWLYSNIVSMKTDGGCNEICDSTDDEDGDGLIDCADPDCSGLLISNVVVSDCIDHAMVDIATVDITVEWTNAPANDIIELVLNGKTEFINVAGGATSPFQIQLMVPADGTTNIPLTASWQNTLGLCSGNATFDAPSACSNGGTLCSILYLCGDDKYQDAEPWDHGMVEYFDMINGASSLTPAVTKSDGSGFGLYDAMNPSVQLPISTLTSYDLVVISPSVGHTYAGDLLDSLKEFQGGILNMLHYISDDLGMTTSDGSYNSQSYAYYNDLNNYELYNYDNPGAIWNQIVTYYPYHTGIGGEAYLWQGENDMSNQTNAVFFAYDKDDVLPGIASHGERVQLGYYMDGFYYGHHDNDPLPSHPNNWFDPVKHLTPEGKLYLDQAIEFATAGCRIEICDNGIDDDGDDLVDCLDPDCDRIDLTNLAVSNCIDHPLQDVATVSVDVSWENAPDNDTIEVSIYGKTEYINVAGGASSPQTINFTVPADGTTGNLITASWRVNNLLCAESITFDSPIACSNDQIACNILYLCGDDKPYDGDAWDHGWIEYLDEVNGSATITPILTKNEAGLGTYDAMNPSTFVNVNLEDYGLIIVSATTEYHISTDLIVALKDVSTSLLNGNIQLVNDFGMAPTEAGVKWGGWAYIDNSNDKEIYNFDNNISPWGSKLFITADYNANADAYLWGNAGDQAAGYGGVIFVYEASDVMPGIAAGHGRRVHLGYHMNGVYGNDENGGVVPSDVEGWFDPAKHLTLDGKFYFDQALLEAAISCNTELCNNGQDDDGDGLTDCDDPDCELPTINNVTSNSPDNCPLLNNGQITVTGTGSNLEYSIDGGMTYHSSNNFTGLIPGSYTVRIRIVGSSCFVNYANNPIILSDQICGEICDNGIDDDGDDLIDCADPDCGPSVFAGTDVTICIGSTIDIIANASGGASPYEYNWNIGTGDTLSVSPELGTTTYFVTVTDGNGCTTTDQVDVTVILCAEDCTDGIDNDGDNLIDCDDPDCLAYGQPQPMFDTYVTCPGVEFIEQVIFNDDNLQDPIYSIYGSPSHGSVSMDDDGVFTYTPYNTFCGVDDFIYQVCNQTTGCCDTASVFLQIGDNEAPILQNIPADITISCDDVVPEIPVQVYGEDVCPGIYISFDEDANTPNAGSCQSYVITRSWTATDLCGNSRTGTQKITIVDTEAPEIFRAYTLSNGSTIIGGTATRVTDNWKYVKFPINYENIPVVFSQVVTDNENTAVNCRIRNVSLEGFELRLQEEENQDGEHAMETVDWIALEEGNVSDESNLQVGKLENVNSNVSVLGYANTFSGQPTFIGSLQSFNDTDPVGIRYSNTSPSTINLFLEEETSADTEVAHGNEDMAFFAMEPGVLSDEDDVFVGESGSLSLDENWITVPLSRKYNKPVVVFGGILSGTDPATVRVKNVTENSFEVRVEEWEYYDGNLQNKTVGYFVMEGSIPAESEYFCDINAVVLEPGNNLFAVDNCDNQLNFIYDESSNLGPTGMQIERSWTCEDDCGNSIDVSRIDTCVLAAVDLKINLKGALLGTSGIGLMRDDLRQYGFIPLEEPYTELNGFFHKGDGGGEVTTADILEVTGDDAVVDWVFVEIRDKDNPTEVVSTCSALLQRDGDVVRADGEPVLYFPSVLESDYFVTVRHRNHLGLMTDVPEYLSTNAVPDIDFSALATDVEGDIEAGNEYNGVRSCWAGDLNGDGKIIFQGPSNDAFALFSLILISPENNDFLANYIRYGYHREDLNMDGKAIFQGPGNDRALLLYNTILAHPVNNNFLSNFIVLEKLP